MEPLSLILTILFPFIASFFEFLQFDVGSSGPKPSYLKSLHHNESPWPLVKIGEPTLLCIQGVKKFLRIDLRQPYDDLLLPII